jgi:hypothetical protein
MKRNLLMLILCVAIFAACKKNSTSDINSSNKNLTLEEKIFNSKMDEGAKAVNKLMQTESFRKYCKSEVLKAFDGDYNFLLSKLVKDFKQYKNQPILYSSSIATNSYYEMDEWPSELMNNIETISNEYPLTQIAVQLDPASWDPNTYIPDVVYLDAAYDEADTDFINGYNANGDIISLNARVEPSVPVIILSTNERGYIDDLGGFTLFNHFESTLIDNPNQILGHPLQPINPNIPIEYYRPNFKYENISALKYDNLSQVEGWPAGAPETYIYVFEQDLVDSTKTNKKDLGYVEPPKRKDINGKWFATNIDTHLWRWYKSGTTIKYGFYEYDAKGTSQIGNNLVAIANFAIPVLDSGKVNNPPIGFPKPNLPPPSQPQYVTILKYTLNVVGQFLAKNIEKSETIGEIEVSVNNDRTEFSLNPGGFKFESQPK